MKNLLFILLLAPLSVWGQNDYQRVEQNTRTFIDIGNKRHYVNDKFKVIQSIELYKKDSSKIDTVSLMPINKKTHSYLHKTH